ncbi:hypothetical protein PYK22_02464 [Pyrinomonas methylaliphatogenes]|jgi:hypothetical protein|uniref:Uncharacterized protein n=1 Tax=Pyrinomonas methylaliphatogenes TaxID=454194 RepID=A0A0B6X1J3_9BACT|nr:hypothetical protein PYK22_02464 [Pyrinomonas methylaliphatogenes]
MKRRPAVERRARELTLKAHLLESQFDLPLFERSPNGRLKTL